MFINSLAHAFTNSFNEEVHDDDKYASQPEYKYIYIYMIGPLAAAEHSFDFQGKSYEEFVWRAISIRQSAPLYHRKQICRCYHHIDSIQKTAGTVGTPSLNDARSSTELLLEQSDHSSDCIGGPEAQYARKHFLHSYGSFLW